MVAVEGTTVQALVTAYVRSFSLRYSMFRVENTGVAGPEREG